MLRAFTIAVIVLGTPMAIPLILDGLARSSVADESPGSTNVARVPPPPASTPFTRGPRPEQGAEVMEWFLSNVNWPYDVSLPGEITQALLDSKAARPDEGQYIPQKTVEPWEQVGPLGMDVRDKTERYSGRLTDIRLVPGGGVRVSAANGGIWEMGPSGWVALGDNLPVLAVGSFDIDPGDADIMYVGTGDPIGNGGVGLRRTFDGGVTWNTVPSGPAGRTYYSVRFAPASWGTGRVHAAMAAGYSRSDNMGENWDPMFEGRCTSIAFDSMIPGTMYAGFSRKSSAMPTGGIYKSTDSGATWDLLTDPVLPDPSEIGEVRLAVCETQPNNVWALLSGFSSEGKEELKWLLRSRDRGVTWEDVGLPTFYNKGQGHYNVMMAVSAEDPDVIVLGGIGLLVSDTGGGGVIWTPTGGVHDDQHVAQFVPGTDEIWLGNDGGIFYSDDNGSSWTTPNNDLPITQYYYLSVCNYDPMLVMGGSQDNGNSYTSDLTSWEVFHTGDGGGVAMKPDACNLSVFLDGFNSRGSNFVREKSSDYFASLSDFESGIDENTKWAPMLRWPRSAGLLYTATKEDVYATPGFSTSWSKLNSAPFADTILEMAVDDLGVAVYVTTTKSTYGGRIFVYKDGVWQDRDALNLPANGIVGKITPHPTLGASGVAHLITKDATRLGGGQFVYQTDDFGETWTDISGDLGFALPTDVIGHPTDPSQVYLGTGLGSFWTPNGGINWFRSDTGAPPANQISEFAVVPTGSGVVGEYWLYAASYGRGMWRRRVNAPVPGAPDPSVSLARSNGAVFAPGETLLAHPDGSGESLASRGLDIVVKVFDAGLSPVSGVAANRITLRSVPTSATVACTPMTADAPTDATGTTTITGSFPWGGYTQQVQVYIDGVAVGAPIDIKVVSTDINGDKVVDLCDLSLFSSDQDMGGYAFRSDFSPDGVLDAADVAILDAALDAPKSCVATPPVLLSPEGEIGVWFDLAATQFGQIVNAGDKFDVYLIAQNIPNGMKALEFRIPQLEHPGLTVEGIEWQRSIISPTVTSGGDFQVVFDGSCTSGATIHLATIHLVLDQWVGGLRLCPEAMETSSFGFAGAPGWLECGGNCSRRPFAETSCAEINPFSLSVYAGLMVEALGPAELVPLGNHLELQGLDSPIEGGMTIYFGGRNPGTVAPIGPPSKSLQQPEPVEVDGAGIFFQTPIPSANLPDGAALSVHMEDANQAPLAKLDGVVSNGMWDVDLDLSAVGSTTMYVVLQGAGTILHEDFNFDGSWQSNRFLPGDFAVLHDGSGELYIILNWGNDPATVVIGGVQYLVDEMNLITQTGNSVSEGLMATATIRGHDVPNVEVRTMGVERFVHGFIGANNVTMISEADRLRLFWDDVSYPGTAEIRGLSGPANFVLAEPIMAPNANVTLRFESQPGDNAGALEWVLVNGNQVRMKLDAVDVGASGWLARGYLAGVQQWEISGSSFDVADADEWPQRARMDGAGLTVEWGSPSDVSAIGGSKKTLGVVDRMEILPQQPLQPLPDGTVVQMAFTDASEISFRADLYATAAPPVVAGPTALHPNVPNPFNPRTEIRYTLSRVGPARLAVYDSRGRLVRELLNGVQPGGSSKVIWDGKDTTGIAVSSGIYFVHLTTYEGEFRRKLTLLR